VIVPKRSGSVRKASEAFFAVMYFAVKWILTMIAELG
jgi:hypothetical protein